MFHCHSWFPGWWFQPLWKIWVRQLFTLFPIYGKSYNSMVPVTTNQFHFSGMSTIYFHFSDLSATGPPVLTMRPTNVPRFTRLQLASQALMTLEMWKTHGKNPWKIIYEWWVVHIYVSLQEDNHSEMVIYIYIYINIEREREREPIIEFLCKRKPGS